VLYLCINFYKQVNIKFTLKRLLDIRLFIDKDTSFKRKS